MAFLTRRRLRLHACVCVIAVSLSAITAVYGTSSAAQDAGVAREYDVKAAFIYNFARFTEWPSSAFSSPQAPLVISILGKDPFGTALDRTVQGKTVGGRSFVLRRLKWGQDLKACQILFVADSEKEHLTQVINMVKEAPILTVGELPGFAPHGGIIDFVMEEGRVRFEINPKAAKRAGLTLSSKLLSLAKVVTETK